MLLIGMQVYKTHVIFTYCVRTASQSFCGQKLQARREVRHFLDESCLELGGRLQVTCHVLSVKHLRQHLASPMT